jgi:hypothetical protein
MPGVAGGGEAIGDGGQRAGCSPPAATEHVPTEAASGGTFRVLGHAGADQRLVRVEIDHVDHLLIGCSQRVRGPERGVALVAVPLRTMTI